MYQHRLVEQAKAEELLFGSSGGGGGEGEQSKEIQFGPQSDPMEGKKGLENTTKFTMLDIHVYDDAVHATPVPIKKFSNPVAKKRTKKAPTLIAENLPTRWIRKGTGPGSGGGAGGGSGGGIGGGIGSSIDWGNGIGRRLLSGKIPVYPEGLNIEMLAIFQFTVLPDGSVGSIIPLQKTNEQFEHSAMVALRTWRFDPLPSTVDQRNQTGRVPFNFKPHQ
jgi:TonB family protein